MYRSTDEEPNSRKMNKLIYGLIKDLKNYNGLLAKVVLTPTMENQIRELVSILNKLPSDSKVLQYIKRNLAIDTVIISIDAVVKNGVIKPPSRSEIGTTV